VTAFVPTRKSGKSDRAVVLDMAKAATPGSILTYEAIIEALSIDSADRAIDKAVASHAARAASQSLLRTDSRCLIAIRGQGYRVSIGSDHHGVALDRYTRADAQLHRGVQVLAHVRRDEMSPNQLIAHDGTMLVMGALVQMTSATRKRQDRIETILARIAGKVGVSLDDDDDDKAG